MSDVTLRNVAADAAATNLEGAWYAIGNGATAGDQVSNERVQPAYSPAASSSAALASTLAFTGPASTAVSHLLVFDQDQPGGTLRFARPLTGDLSFNAAGSLSLIAAPVTVS